MKNILRTLALGMALTASVSAQAGAIYNYAFSFSDGVIASGSATGTASGNLVTGLSNISLAFNGVPVANSGNLFGSSLNARGAFVSGGAVLSFDGLANNVLFNDTNYPVGGSINSFFMALSSFGGFYEFSNTKTGVVWSDSVGNTRSTRWSLTAAAATTAVPEPATIWLLAGGLGLMGLAALRRRFD